MAEKSIIDSLRARGWDSVWIALHNGEYEICVCMDEWVTNDIHQAIALPTGKGRTLAAAYASLLGAFDAAEMVP